MKSVLVLSVSLCAMSAFALFEPFSPVGTWRSNSVRCVKGGVSKAPSMNATVTLNVAETSYTANGRVGGFACNFGGPLTARGSQLRFQITNDGGCPLSNYLQDGFTGIVNGNRMTVTLPSSVADMLCDDQGGTVVVGLSK